MDHYAPLIVGHSPSVIIPIGMLAAKRFVVIHQMLHRQRQAKYLSRALKLDPPSQPLVGEHAKPTFWVSAKIQCLYGSFACTHPDFVFHNSQSHRRHLRRTITTLSCQNCSGVISNVFKTFFDFHALILSRKDMVATGFRSLIPLW